MTRAYSSQLSMQAPPAECRHLVLMQSGSQLAKETSGYKGLRG